MGFYHWKKHIRDKSHNNNKPQQRRPPVVAAVVEEEAVPQHQAVAEPLPQLAVHQADLAAAVVEEAVRRLQTAGAEVGAGGKHRRRPAPRRKQP